MTIGKRLIEHINALHDCNRQYAIHKALLKYGLSNFEIEILAIFNPVENIRNILNQAERVYIYFYDSFENGYNETLGGDSLSGRKWTEEQREHMHNIMLGRRRDPETVDPRSKKVYVYDTLNMKYYEAPSVRHFSIIAERDVKPNQLQACATGKRYSAKKYICAYSPNELDDKITVYNLMHKNKTKKS